MPKANLIIAYLMTFLLLLSLGTWQLYRAHEKQVFLDNQALQQKNSEVFELTDNITDDLIALRYKKVTLTGHYDNAHQFLIDNQINAGKVGYLVLTPFILKNTQRAVLVNRGWIALNQPREILPDVNVSETETILSGRINDFPSVGIKLAGADVPTKTNPAIVQVVNTKTLAQFLSYSLFSFQVELNSNLPNGFKREWQTAVIMQPQQHIAYALQWYGLALVLTFLFIKYGFKKHDTATTQK